MDERILKAILQFGLDKASLEQVRQGTKSIEDGLKQVQVQTDAAMKKYESWKQKAEKLQSVGLTTGAVGAGLAAPFVAAMASYVQGAGKSEAAGQRWLVANERIADSTQRIGKVALQGVLPVIEQVAGLAEKAAGFAEKNPDAVKAILGVAGALVGVGALATVAAQGIRLVADVKYIQAAAVNLAAGKLMDGAANKNLAAAGAGSTGGAAGTVAKVGSSLLPLLGKVLGVAGSVVGGVVAGNALYNASGLKQSQGGLSAEQIWTGTAGVLKATLVGLTQGQDARNKVLAETGDELRKMGGGAEQAATGLRISNEQMESLSKSFVQYQRQEQQAQADLEKEKAGIRSEFDRSEAQAYAQKEQERLASLQTFLKQQAQEETDNQAERSRALRDFHEQDRQAEEDRNTERVRAARDNGIQVQRVEEDLQRSLTRKREDFDLQVEDFLASGDARGYEKALRAFSIDRSRTIEDAQVTAGRGAEDFARQEADREADFQKERARKTAEFVQQQADRQAQFETERARKVAENEQTNKDRDTQFADERKAAKAAFDTKIIELDQQYGEERVKRYNQILEMYRDELGLIDWKHQAEMAGIQGMINAITAAMPAGTTTTTKGSRASGGYVSAGAWRMHDNEFVLNARTTRAAEVAAGGKLDQRTMLGLMAGGRSVVWQDQRRFNSDLSAPQRREITNDTLGILMEGLS